jgi:hypothetical protein
MSRRAPKRRTSCRPLTIYGYRRRRSNAGRWWGSFVVLGLLAVLPWIMKPAAEMRLQPSAVGDSSRSRHSRPPQPSKPGSLISETGMLLTPARADADVTSPVEEGKSWPAPATSTDPTADSGLSRPRSEATTTHARVRPHARRQRGFAPLHEDSAVSVGPKSTSGVATPLTRKRAVGSRLVDPVL